MHLANLSIAEALKSLESSENGLTAAEAARRLKEYGPNRLAEIDGEAEWKRFLREFTHFFAVILWVAAGLAFFAESRSPGEGMWQLALAILAVILINGTFSYWQEYRAERAIDALRKLLPQTVKVVRDRQLTTVAGELLVPGDIILLEAGDNVPADCRLIVGNEIRVNASTITGESLPKARNAEECTAQSPLDTKNVLLAGTSLVSGDGRAIVFATGMHTEFGKIAHLTQTAEKSVSHLQQEIARLSRLVAVFATALGVFFFGIGLFLGLPFWANLMFAIGIIVANVPEGLLPTVTLSLAMATQRMARRNALIRHLPAVETLGSTTVICSDKTGTLTQNQMAVRQTYLNGRLHDNQPSIDEPGMRHLLGNAASCHSLKQSMRDGKIVWLGDPMEVALYEFAAQSQVFEGMAVTGELPFDSERRRMSVIVEKGVEQGGERWLYCKGAPEAVLPLCTGIELDGEEVSFDTHGRHHIVAAQQQLADAGLRVLAFAYRRLAAGEAPREAQMVLSGLIGLYDPPRPEVPEAMARCRTAGIKVIMVTGDHPHTAVAIAREIGLVQGEKPRVVLGESLRRMTRSQLQTVLDAPEVIFARVTAEQKMLVVEALKRKGEIVAVTGDGVNDAPALKMAHIGIAMGVAGTDVAKSAADMILLDDNFASIVNAVEEGRAVFENIRKFLTYILTSNIPEIVPYLAYVLLRIPLPLTIIQILAVDLGTDMVPALALGAEKPDPDVMRQPPRPPDERLLSWPLLARAYLWLGPLQATVSLAAFFFVLHAAGWSYGTTLAPRDSLYLQATTACLAAIVASQVVNLFVCRHPRAGAFSVPLLENRLILLGLAVEIGLILLIVYAPVGNRVFGTQAFCSDVWVLIAVSALAFGGLEEVRKWLFRGSSTTNKTLVDKGL
ncbi:cation-translocating P-type ATPase [Propionivibrio limicola]|uniref:cation-translocating P-type ATPase n=1 Tax=Propionivibrio limicola TaxID=167645 RepID=UPI001290F4D2|nr:cation-transporting P-type ATPase [Propionivibrio limicola]